MSPLRRQNGSNYTTEVKALLSTFMLSQFIQLKNQILLEISPHLHKYCSNNPSQLIDHTQNRHCRGESDNRRSSCSNKKLFQNLLEFFFSKTSVSPQLILNNPQIIAQWTKSCDRSRPHQKYMQPEQGERTEIAKQPLIPHLT